VTTPLGAAPADLAEVERIVRGAGTSFFHGMRVLPPDRRHAMYAIYAFCRIVDDIADGEFAIAQKRTALDDWRGWVSGLFHGAGRDAVTRVLCRAVAAFALREADFLAVIDGMEMDAEGIVAPDLATLDLYCDRVAGAVGRLSVRAFGDASADADRVAQALGRALQLTNVLRDVHEDAMRGRLYLPREYLAAEQVPPLPLPALADPGLAAVCARLACDAHARFAEAKAAMRRCDSRAMRPARLMAATYAAILARLERRGWQHPEQPAKLPRAEKLWIALRYGLT
jgi:squalene synthase HpnD